MRFMTRLAALQGDPGLVKGGQTIAEGIAVRDIGEYPFEIVRAAQAEVLVVAERSIEEAVALLLESAKLVGEGAGVAGLAALIDVLMRNLLRDGRLLRLHLEIPDRPGVLADIATKIGGVGGNIIEVSHQRLFGSPSVQAAILEVMIEARDPQHAAEITNLLSESYVVKRV